MSAGSSPDQRFYWCFISYRHSDNKEPGRQWATWLHQAIETYEVPEDLVGTVNERGDTIPARIFPVFRDEEELPVDADLASPIYRALDASKLLVVICSPRAVASTYVGNEIRYFKQLGRSDRVLAVMIEGEPNASWDAGKQAQGFSANQECFSEAMRHKVAADGSLLGEQSEPIAADFRLGTEQGWTSLEAYQLALRKENLSPKTIEARVEDYRKQSELMKLKVIAGILGVALGTLTKRDTAYQLALAQKRARTLRRWLAAVGLLAILAIVGGGVAFLQKKEADKQRADAISEKNEADAQRKIAVEQTHEVKKLLAESDVDRSDSLFATGDAASALWYLCRAVSSGAPDARAEERLWFALAQRSWPLPVIDPVKAGGDVTGAVFDSAGSRFAIATKQGTVSIFSCVDGSPVGSPLLHPREVRGLLFSPDGSMLLTACDDAVARLWDVRKPAVSLLAGNQHDDMVAGIAWSSDGSRYATGSWDKQLRVWDPAHPSQPVFQVAMKDKVHTVAFDPTNASRVLGVAKDQVCVWDTTSSAPLLTYQADQDLNGASFSPDGSKVLSFGDEGGVVISDLAGGLQQWAQLNLTGSCRVAVISPDGEVFAAAFGTHVCGYSLHQPPEVLWDQNFPDLVSHIKFTTEGKRLVVACDDGKIKVLDAHTGRSLSEPIVEAGTPLAIDFQRAGNRILSARTTQAVRIWSLSPPSPLPKGVFSLGAPPLLLNQSGNVQCVAQNGQGVTFATPSGAWPNMESSKFDFKAPLASAAVLPYGAMAAGTADGRVLALENGLIREVGRLKAAVSQLAVSASGTLVAAGADDGGLDLWHWPQGAEITLGWNHTDRIGGLTILEPGSALVSASWDRSIARTNWQTGGTGAKRWPIDSEPQVVAADPARSMALVGLNNGEIWSVCVAPHEAELAFRVNSAPNSAAFNANGGLAAIGTMSGIVTIWDMRKNAKVSDIACGDAPVSAVCFGAGGRWLAVGTDDGLACVYEISSGRAITEAMPHATGVRKILFSPDEQYVVTATRDGLISIWPLMRPGDAERAAAIARGTMRNGGDRRFVPGTGILPTLDEAGLRHTIANLAGGGVVTRDEIDLLNCYLDSNAKPPSR
jgi:WD40 repeat protein